MDRQKLLANFRVFVQETSEEESKELVTRFFSEVIMLREREEVLNRTIQTLELEKKILKQECDSLTYRMKQVKYWTNHE
jgi:hypothetical protein